MLTKTSIVSHELFPLHCLPSSSSHKNPISPHSTPHRCRVPSAKMAKRHQGRGTKAGQPQKAEIKESHRCMKLLNRSFKAGKFSESLDFLEYMVSKGYKPDVFLCARLIEGLFNSNMAGKAVRVVDILEAVGQPGVAAYHALVIGFCNAGRVESAIEVLGRMRSHGCPPEIVTYNSLINGLCSRGELDLALEALGWLLDDECRPDAATVTALIQAVALQGQTGEAMKILDEMVAQGVQPDSYIIYNAIIRGMCTRGMVDAAHEFLKSLPSRGCSPNVFLYNTLLLGLLRRDRCEDGEHLLGEMLERGVGPNNATYSVLIKSLCPSK